MQSPIFWFRVVSVASAFLAGFWLPIRMIGYIPPFALEVAFDLMISIVGGINAYLWVQHRRTHRKEERLSSWSAVNLMADLICMIPISLLVFVLGDTQNESMLLLNLLCARHVRQIKPLLDTFPSLKPMSYRLIPVLLFLPMLVHVIACGWIALGSGTAGPDSDKYAEYIKAVYWSFTTFTTVGYGDISARTPPQMLFACMVQVLGVGVGLFGFILSNVEVLARDIGTIAFLREGAFFGEMALISDGARRARVKARSFCDLDLLQREAYERVTKPYPDFKDHVEETIQQRSSA